MCIDCLRKTQKRTVFPTKVLSHESALFTPISPIISQSVLFFGSFDGNLNQQLWGISTSISNVPQLIIDQQPAMSFPLNETNTSQTSPVDSDSQKVDEAATQIPESQPVEITVPIQEDNTINYHIYFVFRNISGIYKIKDANGNVVPQQEKNKLIQIIYQMQYMQRPIRKRNQQNKQQQQQYQQQQQQQQKNGVKKIRRMESSQYIPKSTVKEGENDKFVIKTKQQYQNEKSGGQNLKFKCGYSIKIGESENSNTNDIN